MKKIFLTFILLFFVKFIVAMEVEYPSETESSFGESSFYDPEEEKSLTLIKSNSKFSNDLIKQFGNFEINQNDYHIKLFTIALQQLEPPIKIPSNLKSDDEGFALINQKWQKKNNKVKKYKQLNELLQETNKKNIAQLEETNKTIEKLYQQQRELKKKLENQKKTAKEKLDETKKNFENEIPTIQWETFKGSIIGSFLIACTLYFTLPRICNFFHEQLLRYTYEGA